MQLDLGGELDYECPACGAMVSEAEDCPDCAERMRVHVAEDRPRQRRRARPKRRKVDRPGPARFSKTTRRKDKVGLGVLLELAGVFVLIVGVGGLNAFIAFIGLALFVCGFVVARGKTYQCPKCGNSVTRESRICPTCRSALR